MRVVVMGVMMVVVIVAATMIAVLIVEVLGMAVVMMISTKMMIRVALMIMRLMTRNAAYDCQGDDDSVAAVADGDKDDGKLIPMFQIQ